MLDHICNQGESASRSTPRGWLRCAVLVLVSTLAVRNAHAQATDALPTPFNPDAVVRYVAQHRAEIASGMAEARALAQRPALVGALPDPMIMVSADHIPFSGMGVDGSVLVQQEFPLSGVLGARAAPPRPLRRRDDFRWARPLSTRHGRHSRRFTCSRARAGWWRCSTPR